MCKQEIKLTDENHDPTNPMIHSVCNAPAPTLTATGLSWFELFPIPSWPKLFLPQHQSLPLLANAQVCCDPAQRATIAPAQEQIDVNGANGSAKSWDG
jgi:hypothetical protein